VSNLSQYRKYIAFVDGGCKNNGKANAFAYGSFRVYDVTGREEEIFTGSFSLPDPKKVCELHPLMESTRFQVNGFMEGTSRPTNNLAEAASMYTLLSTLQRTGIFKEASVDVYCDSQLIVRQLMGIYRISNKALKKIHANTKAVMLQASSQTHRSVGELVTLHHYSGDDMKLILGH